MTKTHLHNFSEYTFWIRLRIQTGIFILGYLCIIVKASAWGSLFGPRIFLWPFFLYYLSIFTTPVISIAQIVILGAIHDSVFNLPLGLSSFNWVVWHVFLAMQRRYLIKASIAILWGTFALTLCFFNFIEFIVLLKTGYAINPIQSILETVLHIGIFPLGVHLFHYLFTRLGRFQ